MKRVRILVSNWLTRIDVDNDVDYFDINKEAEDIARRLLNQLLDSELENLNLSKKRNFPGIDLAKEDGFAVQVTSQRTAEKIQDSLDKFKKNQLNKTYPKGVRFLILNVNKPNFKKETKKKFTEYYSDFEPDDHIWDKSWLLKCIDAICQSDKEGDRDRFNVIAAILEEEFGAGIKRQERLSNDPLSHLPPISSDYHFPRPPYRYLRRYQKEDANIFFGRSFYIRQLYDRVTRPDSAAVTLLCGQSGVGKSSLLEAGLLPRIEGFSNVIYTRRNREKGLAGTLTDAMKNFSDSFPAIQQSTPADIWMQIESQTGKRLIVILDQAEEVITDPNLHLPDELTDFARLLKVIFSEPGAYPQGRLVLGYRKEYHADMETILEKVEFSDYSPILLEPLDREAIVEVVSGLTRTTKLRERYNLRVEAWLPDIIANDLSVGKSTPVAPVLQFIMSKMWKTAYCDSFDVREFTIDGYRTLREEGLAMKDFFRMQMKELENWNEEVVSSGLALDILNFHTTSMGTARSREMLELITVYRHREDILDLLVSQLKDRYLLFDAGGRINTGEREDKIKNTALAHDILAPVVIDEYNRSPRPGQRAGVILAAKMGEFKRNKDNVFLNETELELLEHGRAGMKALTPDEEELLQKSRVRKALDKKEKKRNQIFRKVSIILLIVFAIFAAIQWKVAEERTKQAITNKELADKKTKEAIKSRKLAEQKTKEAIKSKKLAEQKTHEAIKSKEFADEQRTIAEKNTKKAEAIRLAKIAEKKVKDDPYVALSIAEEAWGLDKNKTVADTIYKIYRENNFYNIIDKPKKIAADVSLSPDGKYVLTGSWDETARLWDLQGNLVREFKGHKSHIHSVSFSPDGKTVLTGSGDATTRLWSLKGDLIREFKGQDGDGRVFSAIFSPDGNSILIGSYHMVRLWDLQGNQVQQFGGHTDAVSSASFSPDGKTILTSSWDKTARLWSRQGSLIQEFKGHKDSVFSAAFSPDGTLVLTGSQDQTARLWDLKGNVVQEFKGHKHSIRSVAFSPDGKTLLTGSQDRTVRLWDIQGNLVQKKFHKNPIHSVTFSPNGNTIAICSEDTVQIWYRKGYLENIIEVWRKEIKLAQRSNRRRQWIYEVAFSPDGKTFFTASPSTLTCIWDLQGNFVKQFGEHDYTVFSMAFSPDGKTILTGVAKDNGFGPWDGNAWLWNLQGRIIQGFDGHNDSVLAVSFSPGGKRILTGSRDKVARLFKLQGELIKELKGHQDAITSVAFSPDGKTILTGSEDKTARLWDLEGKTIQEFRGHKSYIYSVAFSPNGEKVLTGSWDDTARLWDLQGNLVQEFKGHSGEVQSAIFSPDGKHILTGSSDDTARLWNLNGTIVQEFFGHNSTVSSVAFAPDGNTILTGSFDRTARLWKVYRMSLDEFLKKGILKKLTEEQKREYGIED